MPTRIGIMRCIKVYNAGVLLFLAIVGGLLFGCKVDESAEETAPLTSDATATPPPPVETLLRIHGSNTIGSKLTPALAKAFLEAEGARDVETVKGAEREVTVVGTLPGGARKAIKIAAHGSSTAFTDLGAGKADIGMSSRRIKPEEEEALGELGDLTSPAGEHPIALDGLAVFVHPNSRVDALTVSQIRDIFTCTIDNWSDVGGDPDPIKLYARDEKSGTFETFKDKVLRGKEICDEAERFEDSEELSQRVSGDESGIGFAGLPFIGANRDLKVSEGGSASLRPTPFTVRKEDYLLSRRLYFYTPVNSSNSWVRRFVEFAQSNAGQKVVEEVKFIGQALDIPLPLPPTESYCHLERYVDLVRDAEPVPLNFRFGTGSDELDTKANRDLGRLTEWMNDPARREGQILLIGFADSRGSEEANLKLSRERASKIKQELAAEGFRRLVSDGFGEECSVAPNDTEDGYAQNRRVEVWWRR